MWCPSVWPCLPDYLQPNLHYPHHCCNMSQIIKRLKTPAPNHSDRNHLRSRYPFRCRQVLIPCTNYEGFKLSVSCCSSGYLRMRPTQKQNTVKNVAVAPFRDPCSLRVLMIITLICCHLFLEQAISQCHESTIVYRSFQFLTASMHELPPPHQPKKAPSSIIAPNHVLMPDAIAAVIPHGRWE